MKKEWIKFLTPDGGTEGTAVASEPAQSAPAAESSTPSAPEAPTAPSAPAVTDDVASALGVDSPKPFRVDPMKGMGLSKSPRESINDLLGGGKSTFLGSQPTVKTGAVTPSGQTPVAAPAKPITPAAPKVVTQSQLPAQETPVQPKPATPPQTPQAPAQQPEPLINFQGKQWTPRQIEAFLEGQRMAQQQFAPQQPQQPTQNLTPDQERARIRDIEANFIAQTAPAIDLERAGLNITPEQADLIAAGGTEAATTLQSLMQRSVAYGTMLGRKTIAADLNPILHQLQQQSQQVAQTVQPVLEQARQVAIYETENAFTQQFPQYSDRLDLARIVANELISKNPDWAQRVTRDEFVRTVGAQMPQVYQILGIQPQAAQQSPATPAAPAPIKPATPKVVPASGIKPIQGQRPNTPAAVTQPGKSKQGFQKAALDSIAALR